jgi:hypothetical protein
MISVQNNGMSPTNPPKQDNKTNLPLVIGSSLLGGAFAAAVAHKTHSYKEEGNVISTNLDRYTKLDNGLKVEYAFSDDRKKPPGDILYIKNEKITKIEINRGLINTSLDFDEEGHLTKGVKSLGDTSIEYTQVIPPNKGDRIASTEIKVGNRYIPQAKFTQTTPHNGVWKPFIFDIDKKYPSLSEENRKNFSKLAPIKDRIGVEGSNEKVPIRYLGGDIPLRSQVISEKLPKTFEEVVPYLKAQRNKQVVLWGIGVGILAGGSAFLISRLTAKKPEAVPPQTMP